VVLLIRGEGMCPGECYKLRWEYVLLNAGGGMIQIAEGKTKARRRLLPMVPEVYRALLARWEEQDKPTEGWVFPSGSASGHFEQDSAKNQHAKALKLCQVKPFEPYCLRHTALTRLGEAGCNAFILAKIAGHSSIAITQRYVHPQDEAIERAFAGASALLPKA
jgi:integrase